MDNPKFCNNCETVNSPDSKFCNQCGSQLPGAAINLVVDAIIKNEIDSIVKAKMEQLTKFAASLEDKIELDCRKTIDGWFTKGGILGAVLVGLGGVTAGFQVESLKDTMQQTREQAYKVKAEAEQTSSDIHKINETTLKMKREFEGIKEEIAQTKSAIDRQAKMAEKSTEDAQRAFAKIQNLSETTSSFATGVKKQSNELLESVQRTENATFDVFINHAGEPDNGYFKLALVKLHEKGFRISDSNVAQVEVNHNEIVCFSGLNISKAEEIKDILKPFYKDIQVKVKKNSDRGARDLLLKLKGGI